MLPTGQTKKKHPNIVFEIFVVVGVVAVTIMVLVEVLGSARGRTENLTTISQMREYRQALDVYFLDTGYYPNKNGQTSGTTCLADYPDDDCWENGGSVQEDADILNALVPDFLPAIPTGSEREYGEEGDTYYTGAIYQYSVSGRAYIMKYFLIGQDQSCALDNAVGTNVGNDTLCTVSVSL